MSGTQKNLSKHKNKKTKKNTNQYKYINYYVNKSCGLLNNEQLYILYLYFGITGSVISGVKKNILIGKFDHKTVNEYNLFYGRNDNKKMINNNRSCKLIKTISNFFYTSNNEVYKNILILNVNNYIVINFPPGIPAYYNTTKTLYYYIQNYKTIPETIFNELIILLSNIKFFIESKKYKNIILIGHSRGMTIATYVAYILLILSSEDDLINTLPKHHNVKEFINKLKTFISENNNKEIFLREQLLKNKSNKIIYYKLLEEFKKVRDFNIISNELLNLKLLKNSIQKQIYICGTGGYPILWTKAEEFNIFNDFYLNKYIHIISGDNENNIQQYDICTYYNYNMYIYNKIGLELENDINKTKQQKNINKIKQIKNINYTYFNFGSIVFNLLNNNKIECFKIDSRLKDIDENKPLQTTVYEENKNTISLTDYYDNLHTYRYYRYLYKLFMKF
jgi:hypothetical protein